MEFKIKSFNIDLGITPVENIFINNYLALADGNSIKVYLYILKLAYEGQDGDDFDEDRIASELCMSRKEVESAIEYWREEGVLEIFQVDGKKCYQLINIRELYLGFENTPNKEIEIRNLEEDKAFVENKSQELAEINEDITETLMYTKIEEFLGTSLTPNEIMKLGEHLTEFGQEKALIYKGFTHSYEKTGKKNVNYVVSVLRNWALDGVKTIKNYQDIVVKKEEEKKSEPIKSKAKKVKKLKKDERISRDSLKDILAKKMQMDMEKVLGDDHDNN